MDEVTESTLQEDDMASFNEIEIIHAVKGNKTLRPLRAENRAKTRTSKRNAKFYGTRNTKSGKCNGKYYGNILNEELSVKDANGATLKFEPQEEIIDTPRLLPISELLEKYSFKYEVMPDSKKHNSFYLQDSYMNTFFKYYSEYLCIDFLCEIPELELNVYTFNSLDSNGYCEIVSVGLIRSVSDESGLYWLCEIFKKYNPTWKKTKLILCDKQDQNFEIIKGAFPEKGILISFFHSMKALKSDLSNGNNKISDQDANKFIQIFEHMVNATDESAYAELLKQLKDVLPTLVVFFRKTWHSKKDFWGLGMQLNSKIFLKSFNSFLFNVRKIVRPVINTQDSMENVMKNLCFVLESTRKERFQKFTSVFFNASVNSKHVPATMNYKISAMHKYSKFLTEHGAELVFEQISDSSYVKNMKKLSPGKYLCSSGDIVTTTACSCNFFQLFSLPCSHVLAIRKYLSLPLYVESLCASRYISATYQNVYLELQNSFRSGDKYNSQNVEESELFRKYYRLCAELWPLLVECPENISTSRLKIVETLIKSVKHGIKVNLQDAEVDNPPSCSRNVALEDLSTDYWKEVYGISLSDILDSDNDFSSVTLCSEIENQVLQTPLET